VRQGGQPVLSREQANALVEWLKDYPLMSDVADLLTSGIRVPQEAVSLTVLSRNRHWSVDL
jgi:hypothetical protein